MRSGRKLAAQSLVIAMATLALGAAQAPAVLGQWRGRSTCLVKPSPCNSEVVVYEIRRDSTYTDSLSLQMDKIVNGEREWMVTLRCGWHPPALACPMRNGWWKFTQRGDTLAGDLLLPSGQRYRDIEVTRARER